MLMAYINYPNPKVSVHRDASCGAIQKMGKAGQRRVRLDPATISTELQNFLAKHHLFAANSAGNDMWLDIDFGDPDLEAATVHFIHRIVAKHYSPLGNAKIAIHC